MKIDAATATSGAQTSEPDSRPAADPVRRFPRPVYVAMRLEEIFTFVGQMAKERERLTVEIKASVSKADANQKYLRLRRA